MLYSPLSTVSYNIILYIQWMFLQNTSSILNSTMKTTSSSLWFMVYKPTSDCQKGTHYGYGPPRAQSWVMGAYLRRVRAP